MLTAVCVLIIGVGVVLSLEWSQQPPGFRADTLSIIGFGVFAVVVILLGTLLYRASHGAGPQHMSPEERQRKASLVKAIVFFVVGLSVIFSYEWWQNPPKFRTDAPSIILLGILVAAIIYIATRYATGEWASPFRLRFCPACGRQIPFDALLCPYCGQRLP